MDPNVLAAIVGGASGLAGAIIGGVIAARTTNRVAREASEHSLRLQEASQQATIYGALLGLRAEIETLWEIYSTEFGGSLEELKDDEAFFYHYPLHQNYFTVYESNAALFGQIPDDRLRKAIITTYMKARGLVDSHIYNNQLIEGYLRLQRLREETGNPMFTIQMKAAMEDLKTYGKFLKDSYFEMKPLVSNLIEQIDNSVALAGRTSRTVSLLEMRREN